MYVANGTSKCIPFLDLVTPHVELEQELTAVFRRALLAADFIGGSVVEEFEASFAAFCETRYSVAVSSGTDALRFAIMATGVRPGDVVLTVPNTFIATTEAISQAGALPEFIDIDERTYNMSVEKLDLFFREQCSRDSEGKIVSRRNGRRVTAVIPVHLYGQMADMDSILRMADEYGLIVIEDACQAHGAEYFSNNLGRWMKAGSMGHAAAFSFYPGKNLGACGEAGAVTTNDANVVAKIKMFRDHGQETKYQHYIEGYNGRLDAIQAGILHVKLPHLAAWNIQRRERAIEYDRLLSANDQIRLPSEPKWSRAVFHLYVVRTWDRDGLMRHLKAAGIGVGIHYPNPLHLQKAYASLNYARGAFPAAEQAAGEIISLPMFPQLTPAQQKKVAETIDRFTASLRCKASETKLSTLTAPNRLRDDLG